MTRHLRGDQLRALRDRLLADRQELLRRARRIDEQGLDRSLGDSLGELSTYDNHPADIGDELFERSKDLALKGLMRRRLRQVDEALERMRSGLYGLCENCGRPIPFERLVAEPHATLCVRCQELREVAEGRLHRRPVEEEVLLRSQRQLFGDGAGGADVDENVAYDREDAWQEVERYGTSSTPQDDPDWTGYREPFMHPDEIVGATMPIEQLLAADGEPLARDDDDSDEDGAAGRP
ncbi:MAG TPA: TraR/DksA C4-type zinc finger protein [Bacillota bacterium]